MRNRTTSKETSFLFGALVFAVSILCVSSSNWAFAQDYTAIRQARENSVVFIHSQRTRKDGTGVPEHSYGTGFVISEDGYVITASHVVFKEDSQTVVKTTGATRSRYKNGVPLEPVKRDDDIDGILLLFPDTGETWSPVPRGNSRNVPKDAPLYALGFPGNLDLSPATGILSNKFGPKGTWQTTLAINRGQSGGPIFDMKGNLVAVSAAGSDEHQQITFAIPEAYLRGLMQLAVAQARSADSALARFIPYEGSVSTKFTFYQAVDHQAQSSAREVYCVPEEWKISAIKTNVTARSGPETKVLGVAQDPHRTNCVTVDAFIKGAGVKKYGPIEVDYQGRGWLAMDIFLDASKVKIK